MSTFIGIDLQSIGEVEASLDAFGERYTTRLFTVREIDECAGAPNRAQRFAIHFAAKEAVMKVLGLRDRRPPWTTIEVRGALDADPVVSLSGEAAAMARIRGIGDIRLSCGHDGTLALATVVAEAFPTTDGVTDERR